MFGNKSRPRYDVTYVNALLAISELVKLDISSRPYKAIMFGYLRSI